jgi:DNA-binding CsgD family transcriptional regulator/tetratricopeptide (TPR) repeat protein
VGLGERSSSGRGRVFVAIRDHLRDAARDADVVACVDDLHWADRSTLELLSFLSTRLTGARVLVVLAYRSDEVHRRHPLRPFLAEIGRGPVVADVTLEALERTEIQDQLGAILGTAPDVARLERIVALADGNPFHVEELALLSLEGRELPRSLRDVLLARLDRLDDATTVLLGQAAAIGRDIDEGLLVEVSRLSEDATRTALREAVDHHVLVPAPDGRRHRFRHALLREAVLDDLLPSDRTALHGQVAKALEARPELAASSPVAAAVELAYHWSEAGDTARAFPALIEAGRRAQAAHAWTEASEALEHAATIAATGVGSLEPIDLAELRMRSAWLASFAGDLRRGLALGRVAVDGDDGADRVRSGNLLIWLSNLANDAGDFELAVSANERAAVLIPAEPPSAARATAVANLAGRRMAANRNHEAIELVDEAIAICRAVDARAVLGEALSVRAVSAAALGRLEEARAAVDESMAIYRSIGDGFVFEAETIVANDAAALYEVGDFDRSTAIVDEAMTRAIEIGAERGFALWLEPGAAASAFVTGDWPAAAERLERFRTDAVAGFPRMFAIIIEAGLAAGRGDRALVETLVSGEVEASSHDAFGGQVGRIRALAALWDGDPTAAAGHAEEALSVMSGQEDLPWLADILGTAVRAYADLAEHHRAIRAPADADVAAARASELASDAAALGNGTYLDGANSTPWMRAIVAQAMAEAGRAADRTDGQAWEAAAAAHTAVGTVPDVAYCRYRQAEALLRVGDRAAAISALAEGHAIARRVGIRPLLDEITALARRARLSIDEPPLEAGDPVDEPPVDPWGLSRREREVLALVAEGRTNRQIGEALFISGKTASVHVTHILDKLGVSSRTEAALLAGRRGVDGDERIAPP